MEGLHVFLFFQIPGKKGFKFHAQPQTGAYSCYFCRNIIFWDEHLLNVTRAPGRVTRTRKNTQDKVNWIIG